MTVADFPAQDSLVELRAIIEPALRETLKERGPLSPSQMVMYLLERLSPFWPEDHRLSDILLALLKEQVIQLDRFDYVYIPNTPGRKGPTGRFEAIFVLVQE